MLCTIGIYHNIMPTGEKDIKKTTKIYEHDIRREIGKERERGNKGENDKESS